MTGWLGDWVLAFFLSLACRTAWAPKFWKTSKVCGGLWPEIFLLRRVARVCFGADGWLCRPSVLDPLDVSFFQKRCLTRQVLLLSFDFV